MRHISHALAMHFRCVASCCYSSSADLALGRRVAAALASDHRAGVHSAKAKAQAINTHIVHTHSSHTRTHTHNCCAHGDVEEYQHGAGHQTGERKVNILKTILWCRQHF